MAIPRTILRGVLLLALAGALGASSFAGHARAHPSTAANRAAAHRDAQTLLSKMPLPPGAIRLASEPSGDHGYLKGTGDIIANLAHATAHQWWQVSVPPSQAISYAEAHRPSHTSVWI